jgi:hypothetical protein
METESQEIVPVAFDWDEFFDANINPETPDDAIIFYKRRHFFSLNSCLIYNYIVFFL